MLGLGLVLASLALLISAQDSSRNETIWSSVIYTYHGDRTPLIWPAAPVLTPLGAQQLYSAGSFFRKRYLGGVYDGPISIPTINNISTDVLESKEIFVMSTAKQYVGASAQAFMQGLYPPTNTSLGGTSALISPPDNKTMTTNLLKGYQYPRLYTAAPQDFNSIFINGHANCPLYYDAKAEFVSSEEALKTKSESQDFYNGIQSNILDSGWPGQEIDFDHAYLIFDSLNYGYLHGENTTKKLTEADLARARDLASQQIRAFNGYPFRGGPSSGKSIQTIAGQSLVTEIAYLLLTNLQSQGVEGKLNLLFGSFDPIIAFFVLTGSTELNKELSNIPDPGSSLVLEMFSNNRSNDRDYPGVNDLYVRLLFRNGTGLLSSLVTYPLFGGGDTLSLSLSDFSTKVQNVSTYSPENWLQDWCSMCQSNLIFCAAYSTLKAGENDDFSLNYSATNGAMKPAIAGVIGAIVALAVASIVFALLMLVGGLRLHRAKPNQRSELGGFKAGKKLPSDQDVPDNKSEVGPSAVSKEDDRVKSWELREQGKTNDKADEMRSKPDIYRRESFETDEIGQYQSIEPTKADDRV